MIPLIRRRARGVYRKDTRKWGKSSLRSYSIKGAISIAAKGGKAASMSYSESYDRRACSTVSITKSKKSIYLNNKAIGLSGKHWFWLHSITKTKIR
jgi:hypothetical protein